ncbi:MAG: hypothetical protein U0X91_27740 [Spirosomataceae bacterium]
MNTTLNIVYFMGSVLGSVAGLFMGLRWLRRYLMPLLTQAPAPEYTVMGYLAGYAFYMHQVLSLSRSGAGILGLTHFQETGQFLILFFFLTLASQFLLIVLGWVSVWVTQMTVKPFLQPTAATVFQAGVWALLAWISSEAFHALWQSLLVTVNIDDIR